MFEVTSSVKLDDSEIQLDFIRASGPVGQNVNKVSIAIQLRFARASFSSIILASSFFCSQAESTPAPAPCFANAKR